MSDTSQQHQSIAGYYTRRHAQRRDMFGDQPFANYGYWTRPDLNMAEASEAMASLVAASAGLSSLDDVLDVGCGYGACAVVYAQRFAPRSITGVDITEIRIEEGRKYVERCGHAATVQLEVGSATQLRFAENSFDKVLAVECAFHFDTRADFFREAARVLRPGGVLALTDLLPAETLDIPAYLTAANQLAMGLDMYHRVNAYPASVYREHLIAAGFVDILIENITPFALARFIPKVREYAQRPGTVDSDKIMAHADKLQRVVDLGEQYVLVVARLP